MLKNDFNQANFETSFVKSLERLANSERITKEELKVLSRSILEAVHATGDISYVNRLLLVLTPVNKKVTVFFFKHFAGFSFDDTLAAFTKKSKKRYDAAVALSDAFLADVNQNIWTWAERHIEVEQKPFTIETLEHTIKGMFTKAGNAGLSQTDVLRAMFKGGLEVDTMLTMLDELGYVEAVPE